MNKKLSVAISIAGQGRYVTKAVDVHYPAIDSDRILENHPYGCA